MIKITYCVQIVMIIQYSRGIIVKFEAKEVIWMIKMISEIVRAPQIHEFLQNLFMLFFLKRKGWVNSARFFEFVKISKFEEFKIFTIWCFPLKSCFVFLLLKFVSVRKNQLYLKLVFLGNYFFWEKCIFFLIKNIFFKFLLKLNHSRVPRIYIITLLLLLENLLKSTVFKEN